MTQLRHDFREMFLRDSMNRAVQKNRISERSRTFHHSTLQESRATLCALETSTRVKRNLYKHAICRIITRYAF